jgi:thiol-disulfide isomerase/thioredoxin
MRFVAILLFFVFHYVSNGQSLVVGEKAPDLNLKVFNFERGVIKLSEFKGKLILLDFWATWCTSCVAKFPKLELLQSHFKNNLQIILINSIGTTDNEEKIKTFYEKWKKKFGKDLILPTVVSDSELVKWFPHLTVPHYVWINMEGYIQAITSSEEVTSENITSVLQDTNFSMPIKADREIERPMLSIGNPSANSIIKYCIFLKGKREELPSRNVVKKSSGTLYGVEMINIPLMKIYETIADHLIPDYNKRKMILEIRDSSKLFIEKSLLSKSDWENENLFTYNLIIPISGVKELYDYMLEELNRCSDYIGKIEKRKMKCYTLIRLNDSDKIHTKGGESSNRLNEINKWYLSNLPISRLTSSLNDNKCLKFPVIDETGYTNNIDIKIQTNLNDFTIMRNELQQYDLDLIEKEMEIEVFVLKEKSQKMN